MSVVLGALEYEHDELGNLIKRRCLKKGLVKQYVDKDGYLKYHLGQTHGTFNAFVHRVVWLIFNGEIPEGMTVDHIDGDKSNNLITNLQLMTAEENAVKGNAKWWVMKDPDGNIHEIYNMTQFCEDRSLHAGHMMDVAKGKKFYHQHKGWTKP